MGVDVASSKEFAFGLRLPGNSDPTFWECFNHHTNPLPECEDDSLSTSPDRVYFLHFPHLRRVKVGISKNVAKRRRCIEAEASGLPSVLIGTLNGGRRLEALMHRRFADHRVSGEWFSDEILEDAETLIRADREFYGEAA